MRVFASVMYVFAPTVGLATVALSSVVGLGSSIILLPIHVHQYGPKQGVPISALISNIGKVAAQWRDVELWEYRTLSTRIGKRVGNISRTTSG